MTAVSRVTTYLLLRFSACCERMASALGREQCSLAQAPLCPGGGQQEQALLVAEARSERPRPRIADGLYAPV